MTQTRCISVAEECWEDFMRMFEALGFKIQQKELPNPFGIIRDYHEAREVIDAVYSVQGLKRNEGETIMPIIERLVSEYAKIK